MIGGGTREEFIDKVDFQLKISFWKKIVGLFRLGQGIDISYSRISAYRFCPWKYKLIYEQRLRTSPNPYISFGLSIHRALDDFHARKADSLDELTESYNTSWVNEGFVSPQQAQEFYEKGKRALENYWKNNLNSKTEILYVEKEFRIPFGRNFLRGIIDRIDRHPDGTYEIIDYKTHSQPWDDGKINADLQLSIYAYAVEKAFGFIPGILSYYFIVQDNKLSIKRSEEQIRKAVEIVNSTAGKIVSRDFTPNLYNCKKCDFKKNCKFSK